MPKQDDKQCPWCERRADRLCDGVVIGGTCDSPVCSSCSTHLVPDKPISGIVCVRGGKGKGCYPIDNRGDLCPFCAGRREGEPLERVEHQRQLALGLRCRANGLKPGERIYLLDMDNIVHRLYHAVPIEFALNDPTRPINVVIGIVRQLRKLRNVIEPKPQWMISVFDGAPAGGWRRRAFEGYKSGRPPQPPELEAQWGLARDVLAAMQLQFVRLPGVEADDLIGSYTAAALGLGLEVVVVSDDKDLMQLLRGAEGPGSVRQMSAFGQVEMHGPAHVRDKFGVAPEQLGDLLALMGDRSDSIPGVPNVGVKKAAKLLAEFGSLENVLAKWDFHRTPKMRVAIRDSAEQVRLNRRLVELSPTPLPLELDGLKRWVPSRRALDDFFLGLGFPRFEAAIDRHPE